eukprot:893795-Rhodomonas_salina.2
MDHVNGPPNQIGENSFVAQTARRLRVFVFDFGVGPSLHRKFNSIGPLGTGHYIAAQPISVPDSA